MQSKELKNNKIKKVVKHVLFIFTFLGNNQLPSELSDLTEADMRLENSKWYEIDVDLFDVCKVLFSIQNGN